MNTNININIPEHEEEQTKPKPHGTRREYMREYMKAYNLKKGRKPREESKLTPEQRAHNLKESQKKYYLKNKDFIKKKRALYLHNKKLEKLKNKINYLESFNLNLDVKQ